MIPQFTPPNQDSLAEADVYEGIVYESQCTVVEGVVAPGQGAWCGPKPTYDIHRFSLAGWRRSGGNLVQRELIILRPVPPLLRHGPGFDRRLYEDFQDYSIQRLSVLLSTDQTRAVFHQLLKADELDESLALISKRLREPVVVPTEQFGELTLNPIIGWFEGKTKWNRKTIDIRVERDSDSGMIDALTTAASLWSDQAAWKRKVDDFAVAKLLPIKNDSWLEDGEEELTAKRFKNCMKLVSITVGGNGRFEFWHDDGNIFLGHSIQIRGNLKDGLTDADIPG